MEILVEFLRVFRVGWMEEERRGSVDVGMGMVEE